MRTIKTRETVKGIKVLDKSVNLSKRMKDSFVRTKEYAEETREPHNASPTDYAVDTIQDKTQGAAQNTAHHLPNPRVKARENMERAKGHFQEVKRQLPQERRAAADQAQKTAVKTRDSADSLRNVADKTGETAKDAKSAVKDAKQTLKQVRQEGRQTLREVRQSAKSGATPETPKPENPAKRDFMKNRAQARADNARLNGKTPDKPTSANSARSAANSGKPVNSPVSSNATTGGSRPSYMSRRINPAKSAGDTAKSVEKTAKTAKKTVKETTKGTIKTAKKSVKTAEQTAKQAVKTAQQAAKTAQKTAQAAAKAAKVAEKAARAAAKAAVQTAKAVTKAVIALVKAVIAAIKGLIAAIAAGGWVAVLIILIICLIGLLIGSIFGIFFSSEPDPSSGLTINGVITEINTEYTGQIDAITSTNAHDLLDMSGVRASWKQVLAVYTVRTISDPDNPMEVATMTDEKAAILRAVFWDMNTVSHTSTQVDVEEDILDDDDLPTGETTTVTYTVLRITVSHRTPDEMAAHYGFTAEQKEWLEELLKPEYNSLWNALLYGISSVGDGSMIEIADTQIGNIGGEPYWSWYGFSSRVEWCACFVSWCAEQCGFIDAGIIPRFSSCSDGVQWFKDRGQWQDNTYTPAPGDIIFFDWEPDGDVDHVGIVESVTDGVVNTIEGNSSDSCRRRSYDLGSIKIIGYGIPRYDTPVS